MPKKVKLKIFGERNTGTNYLSELINSNLDVHLLKGSLNKNSLFTFREWSKDLYFYMTSFYNFGWKHSKIDSKIAEKIKENFYIISLTKNPYSYLLSLFQRPYHYNKPDSYSFMDFITNKWPLTKRDNVKYADYLQSPVELWNIKNKSYKKFPNKSKIIHIKYEDLLENPLNVVKLISSKINVPLKEDFINHINSTKNDNKSFIDYQNYYLNEEWRTQISSEEYEYINSKIDQEVVNYFGYKLYEK